MFSHHVLLVLFSNKMDLKKKEKKIYIYIFFSLFCLLRHFQNVND